MVALPWGSRSMSSTLRLVAASEAARFTVVVVLPTPPFWLAIASTLPTGISSRFTLRRPLQNQQMPAGITARYRQLDTALHTEIVGQRLQFILRIQPLHRQPPGLRCAQMPGQFGEVGQRAECSGHYTVKRPIWGKGFHPAVRSEEHTSELQSRPHLVCRLLLEKKKRTQ